MSGQSRLDAALVSRGLSQSRQRAKELIAGGFVTVGGEIAEKASQSVCDSDDIAVTGGELRYASRAGLKLEHAARELGISFEGMICADIGASTGGFTDYMLQNGARHVYAVDVGHDQLAEKLKSDSRVTDLEGVNVKELDSSFFDKPVDIMTTDLSFISLKTALPFMLSSLRAGASLVLLIKPQFEAGRSAIGKGGIVKDRKVHQSVLSDMCAFVCAQGVKIKSVIPSPITGGDGNIEYLLYGEYAAQPTAFESDIKSIVQSAFETHKRNTRNER